MCEKCWAGNVVGIKSRPSRIVQTRGVSSLTSLKRSGAELSMRRWWRGSRRRSSDARVRPLETPQQWQAARAAGADAFFFFRELARSRRGNHVVAASKTFRVCRPRYPIRMRFSISPKTLDGAFNSMMSRSGRQCGGLVGGDQTGRGDTAEHERGGTAERKRAAGYL